MVHGFRKLGIELGAHQTWEMGLIQSFAFSSMEAAPLSSLRLFLSLVVGEITFSRFSPKARRRVDFIFSLLVILIAFQNNCQSSLNSLFF